MGRKKFFDLTPENNISLDTLNTYKEAIDESFKNNKIKNVAISGSYGSGKSSILESYKKSQLQILKKSFAIGSLFL